MLAFRATGPIALGLDRIDRLIVVPHAAGRPAEAARQTNGA